MDNLTMPESFSERPLPAIPAPTPDPERYEPIHPGSGRPGIGKRLASALAALGVLLAKAKSLIFLLPKLKLLTTFGSMVVSIAAYGLLFGLPFAVGFVLLLFLHEIGHVIQLRREGIKASAPMFIPFLGAAMAALSPAIWLLGLAGLIALTVFYPSPILFLILIFGGMESWRRWKARATPEGRSYYAIPARTRLLVGATYLGLAAALSVGVAETFLSRGL